MPLIPTVWKSHQEAEASFRRQIDLLLARDWVGYAAEIQAKRGTDKMSICQAWLAGGLHPRSLFADVAITGDGLTRWCVTNVSYANVEDVAIFGLQEALRLEGAEPIPPDDDATRADFERIMARQLIAQFDFPEKYRAQGDQGVVQGSTAGAASDAPAG
jgi:hypothetical protein